MQETLFSIKMRASEHASGKERHISGAEKIIPESKIADIATQLIQRALHHTLGEADFVNLKLEKVDKNSLLTIDALPVSTRNVESAAEGLKTMRDYMLQDGIDNADAIMEKICETYAIRGAMLLNVDTLESMEPDPVRGIRATYMDLLDDGSDDRTVKNYFKEALVLASKVSYHPNILGELCISDDPNYVTGYYASKTQGYVRITQLKESGDSNGGRIFLFRGDEKQAEDCIRYMQEQRVLVDLHGVTI